MTMSACAAQRGLDAYLTSLTLGITSFDYTGLASSSALETTLGSATLVGVGAAIALGRVVLGEAYLTHGLFLVVALVGAISGNAAVSQKSILVQLLDGAARHLGGDAEMVCLANLAFVVGVALALGSTALRVARFAAFATGAVAAGYVAYVGLTVLATLPVFHELLGATAAAAGTPLFLYATVAIAAFSGGTLAQHAAFELVDIALALVGSMLLAQGLLSLASTLTLLPSEALADADRVPYYHVGTALVLLLLRQALVGRLRAKRGQGYYPVAEQPYHKFREVNPHTEGLIAR